MFYKSVQIDHRFFKYGRMYLLFLFIFVYCNVYPCNSLKLSKSKINIPYVTPSKNSLNRGIVILDRSQGGNGELPFVEIVNGDAYFYKTPNEYTDTTITKRERELEDAQSKSVSHFDFINELIANWRGRI